MNNSIIVLSYDYPPNDGGISRLTAAFAMGLSEHGIKVEVCTLDGSTITQGLSRPKLLTSLLPRNKGWREVALIRYILSKSRQVKIITTLWNPEGTIAWLLFRRNLYVLAHGNEVMSYPNKITFRIKNWLRFKVLSSARCVICNSSYTESLVKKLVPTAKTKVINPGVDSDRYNSFYTQLQARQKFNLPSNKKLVLSVSRIDEYKGHDVVLEALKALPEVERNQLHYVVAGKGSHLENLKQQAIALNLQEHISWLGFVADDELPILYKSADLFVLCTREDKRQRGVEGFGMVFLEAQAAGLAVIGTRAGGIPDAISEGNGGWLIEQDDRNALVHHLQTLIGNPEIIKAQGILGKNRTQNQCNWQNYVNNMVSILENKQ